MRRLGFHVLIVATLMLLGAPRGQASTPQPNIPMSAAIGAFVDAVNLACIYSKVVKIPLDALPSGVEDDLIPADAGDRAISMAPKDRPLWVSKTLGNHLEVFNDKDGTCRVIADQLPVQRTLDTEARYLRELGTKAYEERSYIPGYNPVGYEFVRSINGDILTVHMEGAEPGLPLHASRFSLITVRVTRTPSRP